MRDTANKSLRGNCLQAVTEHDKTCKHTELIQTASSSEVTTLLYTYIWHQIRSTIPNFADSDVPWKHARYVDMSNCLDLKFQISVDLNM